MSNHEAGHMPIGDLLRMLRLKAGMTQEAWAARLQVDRGHYSLIEVGKRLPSPSLLGRMAEGAGVPVEQLVDADRIARQGRTANKVSHQLFIQAITNVAQYLDDEDKADIVRIAHERAYRSVKGSSNEE